MSTEVRSWGQMAYQPWAYSRWYVNALPFLPITQRGWSPVASEISLDGLNLPGNYTRGN